MTAVHDDPQMCAASRVEDRFEGMESLSLFKSTPWRYGTSMHAFPRQAEERVAAFDEVHMAYNIWTY